MPHYVFAYHGGRMPETPEEGERMMKNWMDWMNGLGDAMPDHGRGVGQSKTLNPDGSVDDNGGANPISGYSVVKADTIEEAIDIARNCPILPDGGSIEIAEALDM